MILKLAQFISILLFIDILKVTEKGRTKKGTSKEYIEFRTKLAKQVAKWPAAKSL